jgi:hypothetical protein
MMLLSWVWKLLSTRLLWKLSVIALDSLWPVNKESVIGHRRFSCSYLIINLHVKLVKLLMLLIILLLILRWNLLFIYKLLLLFGRYHIPILLTDHLVTLNPLMLLLWAPSQLTEVPYLLRVSGCPMKTFSNKSIHRRWPLWITRVSLFIFNNRPSTAIQQKRVYLQIILIILLNTSIVCRGLLPFNTCGSLCSCWGIVSVRCTSVFEIVYCRGLAL